MSKFPDPSPQACGQHDGHWKHWIRESVRHLVHGGRARGGPPTDSRPASSRPQITESQLEPVYFPSTLWRFGNALPQNSSTGQHARTTLSNFRGDGGCALGPAQDCFVSQANV
eukprot:570106-Prymnesium_polylepis.1